MPSQLFLAIVGLFATLIRANEHVLDARVAYYSQESSCMYTTILYNDNNDLQSSVASLSSSYTFCNNALKARTAVEESCMYTTIMYDEPWELATTMEMLSVSYTTCDPSSTSSSLSAFPTGSDFTSITSTFSSSQPIVTSSSFQLTNSSISTQPPSTTSAPTYPAPTFSAPPYTAGACSRGAAPSCTLSGAPVATSGLLAVATGVSPAISGNNGPAYEECARICTTVQGCNSWNLDRNAAVDGTWTCYVYSGVVSTYAVSYNGAYSATVWFQSGCYTCANESLSAPIPSISSSQSSSITVSAPACSAIPGSVIENGGFENWSSYDAVNNWTNIGNAELYQTSFQPVGGQYSVMMYHQVEPVTFNLTQTVSVCPYTDYNLTLWVSNDQEHGDPCDLSVCFGLDCAVVDTERVVWTDQRNPPDRQFWAPFWRKYSGTGASNVAVGLTMSKCALFVMFDNVAMTPLGASLPVSISSSPTSSTQFYNMTSTTQSSESSRTSSSLSLVNPTQSACSATSVIQNGDFETWTNYDTATNWTTSGGAGPYQWDYRQHNGSYSIMMYHGGGAPPSWNLSQTLTLCPYIDYNLTFYIVNDGEQQGSSCDIDACFGNDCTVVDTQLATGHSDNPDWIWHQATRTYRGNSDTSVKLSIGVTSCPLFLVIDDVGLTSLGASPPSVTSSLSSPIFTSSSSSSLYSSSSVSAATTTKSQPVCSATGTSVVQNGGFEDWIPDADDDTTSIWQLTADGSAVEYQADYNWDPHGGQYSLLIYHQGDNPTWDISQSVSVCPYTDYNLTFWVANDNEQTGASCSINACFDQDCAEANTQTAGPNPNGNAPIVWSKASRLYEGTASSRMQFSIGVTDCPLFLLLDDVSMVSVGDSSQPSITSSAPSSKTPTPTLPPSCSNVPKSPCFYITGHGDDRIEGRELGVELPASDGTDEAYARFDITPSIWWIDDNQYLHVAEPLDRVTMTEYTSNQEWWEVFTMDHVAADPDNFQPSLCSILPNGNLDCFQESNIQSNLITLYSDFSPEEDVPAYYFPYWGGEPGSGGLGDALTLSTTVTECPSLCDDSNDGGAASTTHIPVSSPTPLPSLFATVCDGSSTSNTGTYTNGSHTFTVQCNTEPNGDRPMTLVQVKTFGECMNACAADIAGGCIGVVWSQLAADIHFGYPYCALVNFMEGPYQPYTDMHVALLGSPSQSTTVSTVCDTSSTSNTGTYSSNGHSFSLQCNTEPNEDRPMTLVQVKTFGECIDACAADIAGGCIGVYWSQLAADIHFGYPYCALVNLMNGPYQPMTGQHVALLTTMA